MTTSPIEWCGASTRGFGSVLIGPCVLRHGHDGPVHRDEVGVSWTDPRPASESSEMLCPPALRERLAEAAAEWAYSYPISANALGRTDDGAWKLARIWGEQIARIAVLPVVEAWAAEQTQRVRDLHTPVPCECVKCNARRHEGLDDQLCAHCTDLLPQGNRDGGIRYPCPTIAALDDPKEPA